MYYFHAWCICCWKHQGFLKPSKMWTAAVVGSHTLRDLHHQALLEEAYGKIQHCAPYIYFCAPYVPFLKLDKFIPVLKKKTFKSVSFLKTKKDHVLSSLHWYIQFFQPQFINKNHSWKPTSLCPLFSHVFWSLRWMLSAQQRLLNSHRHHKDSYSVTELVLIVRRRALVVWLVSETSWGFSSCCNWIPVSPTFWTFQLLWLSQQAFYEPPFATLFVIAAGLTGQWIGKALQTWWGRN